MFLKILTVSMFKNDIFNWKRKENVETHTSILGNLVCQNRIMHYNKPIRAGILKNLSFNWSILLLFSDVLCILI